MKKHFLFSLLNCRIYYYYKKHRQNQRPSATRIGSSFSCEICKWILLTTDTLRTFVYRICTIVCYTVLAAASIICHDVSFGIFLEEGWAISTYKLTVLTQKRPHISILVTFIGQTDRPCPVSCKVVEEKDNADPLRCGDGHLKRK